MFLGLDFLGFHFVFIDEHSVNEVDIKPYMWTKAGKIAKFVTATRQTSLTSFVAISEHSVNFFRSKCGTNDVNDFVDFLGQLEAYLIQKLGSSIDDVIIIFDGASIHCTKKVHKYLNDSCIRVLVNVRYTPELNAAEKHILFHKNILRKRMSMDR